MQYIFNLYKTSNPSSNCVRGFILAYNTLDLLSHKRTHTEEKSYKCQNCGKEFRYLNDIEIH